MSFFERVSFFPNIKKKALILAIHELFKRLKDISTPDFSTPDFSTPSLGLKNPGLESSWLKSPGLKSSCLKSPGLKGLGLKLGVEKSGVEMSFNPHPYEDLHVLYVYQFIISFKT